MNMFLENVRMAFQSLLANKTRAFLTMLGIIIGISSVIAIMTVGDSMTSSLTDSMQSMGANNVTVYVTSRNTKAEEREDGTVFGKLPREKSPSEDDFITDEMIYNLIDAFPDDIDAISAELSIGNVTVSEGRKKKSISVNGVSLGYFIANEKKIIAGNIFGTDDFKNARNVIVVGQKLVDDIWDGNYKAAVGKTITGTSQDGNSVEYTVVGVFEEEETAGMFDMGGGSGFIPLTAAKTFLHRRNYASIDVVTKAGTNSDDVAGKIKSFMSGYYRNNQYYTVSAFSMASMLEIMDKMMSTIVKAIAVIAGIALIVGGIGVMNIMLVSITERTREIGTRKALGAPNSSIRMQFITEAMIICLIGGIIGVILGVSLGIFAAHLMGTEATPSFSSILISLGFSLAIGLFFGYYPANKAAKMNPIDALRYE